MKRTVSFIMTVFILVSVILSLAVGSYGADKPVVTVDNYIVTITNADLIKDIRYVLGDYNTPNEIKNASGNVALSNAIVVKHTTDRIFTYEMPNAGLYSIWIRMSDGTNYVETLDINSFTPYVSVDAVKITIHNLYDVKDIFIDKGTHNSYAELKADGYIYSVGAAKIGNRHNYTYTLQDDGAHTVLIRYNNGEHKIFHKTLSVDKPEFTPNGLRLVISKLSDVKVIRTAYGKHNTVRELKATDTIRNFAAKTFFKDNDTFTVQYRNEGIVTVIVEHNNGYNAVYHYNVKCKKADMDIIPGGVKFGGLEGAVMIRYVKGEYSTSKEIKAAAGSKVIKADQIENNGYRFMNLEDDTTYTFCVQFDDESYNYFQAKKGEGVMPAGNFSMHHKYSDSDAAADTLSHWLYEPARSNETISGADDRLVILLHSSHVKATYDPETEQSLTVREAGLQHMMNSAHDDLPEYFYDGIFGDISAYMVMPQTNGDSRGWAMRAKELADLTEYYKKKYNVADENVTIAGYSLGGTGALEVAAAYPNVFKNVLSVAGGLDGVSNNNRPYIQDIGRIELTGDLEYLQVQNGKGGYEKQTMKYWFAPAGNKYAPAEGKESDIAKKFRDDRIKEIADKLRNGGVAVRTIVGSKDVEVAPDVSELLCIEIGEKLASCEKVNEYSHAMILDYCIGKIDDIYN